MALVKNIHGSSNHNPPAGYGSWKEYWEANKHRKFQECSCVTCHNDAEVGGHVKKVYSSGEWYIIPICYEHNNYAFNVPYTVDDSDMLRVL